MIKALTYPASAIPYENTASGLVSGNVQDAVDELALNVILPDPYEYLQVPNRLVVPMNAAFTCLSSSGVRIFKADLSRGFEAMGQVTVNSTGVLAITAGAKGTVRGV